MESRLAVVISHPTPPAVAVSPSLAAEAPVRAAPPVEPPGGAAVAAGTPAVADEAASGWPDDAAESAFRAEARERGESVPSPSASEVPEVVDPKTLPSLDSLVQRIPGPVRDSLEDLFRARFVKVDRIAAKVLKG